MPSSYDPEVMVRSPVTYLHASHFLLDKNEDELISFIVAYGKIIETLQLTNADISPETADQIGVLLPSLPSLRRVIVSSGMILDHILGAGRDGVVKQSSIVELTLFNINMDLRKCERLTAYLMHNPCLYMIERVRDCNIADYEMIADQVKLNSNKQLLLEKLPYFSARTFLSMKNNNEDKMVQFIMGHSKNIKTLNLFHADISLETADTIGHILPLMRSLRIVYFSSGMVLDRMLGASGDKGVKKSSIDTLYLDGVKLDDYECQRLTAYLANNPCLCTIYFDNCQLVNKAMIENQLERNKFMMCSICQNPIRME
jgi:hypothetical protein